MAETLGLLSGEWLDTVEGVCMVLGMTVAFVKGLRLGFQQQQSCVKIAGKVTLVLRTLLNVVGALRMESELRMESPAASSVY